MSGVTNAWTIDDVLDRRATEQPDALRRNTAVASAGDVFVTIAPGWQETDDDSDLDTPHTTVPRHRPRLRRLSLIRKQTGNHFHTRRRQDFSPYRMRLLRIRSPNGASLPRLRW